MGEYNHNTELQRKTCGWHIKTVSKGQSEKGRQLNLLTSGGKVSTGTLQSGRERDSKVHNTFSHQRNAMKGTSNRAAVMKRTCERLPWWSSGWDSSLPTKGARVRSLVGELRSFMPCSATKKKKKNERYELLARMWSNTTLRPCCQENERKQTTWGNWGALPSKDKQVRLCGPESPVGRKDACIPQGRTLTAVPADPRLETSHVSANRWVDWLVNSRKDRKHSN